ncbi:MAG: pyridoxal phosphate-dependent aminotransferase [Deltaproteobacteria bacterium]
MNHILAHLPRSGVRRIADKVIELDLKKSHIIHLGLGQYNEPASAQILRSASEAALQGYSKYTHNCGLLELRTAIKKKLETFNHIVGISENNIFVTPGATYGISISVGCLINPGDEVLVPDPGYPNFANAVLHFGGKVKYYSLQDENDYRIDFDQLESLVTPQTKMMILNSPSNPIGMVLNRSQIESVTQFVKNHHLWLLSDEVYETYVYSGHHISPMSLSDDPHIVGVYSFSKSYNMSGFRIGYIVAKDIDLCRGLMNAQELYISSAPTLSQKVAIDVLHSFQNVAMSLKDKISDHRNLALTMLNKHINYHPQGAFYVLVDICKTGLTSDEFADYLLEYENVAVTPCATFGPSGDSYIRISLTEDREKLAEGIRRICKFLERKDFLNMRSKID